MGYGRGCGNGIWVCAILACLAAGMLWVSPAQAGQGPDNMMLVVNQDSWASQTLANEYIRLRQISPNHVIYLKLNDAADFESYEVEDFRQRILSPVLHEIVSRGLGQQINCIVYSADLPYRVTFLKDVGDTKVPRSTNRGASINGMTYLFQWVMAKKTGYTSPADVGYLSLNSNYYFKRTPNSTEEKDLYFSNELKDLKEAFQAFGKSDWAGAEKLLREVLEHHQNTANVHYNLACCLARQDKPEEAVAELAKAVEIDPFYLKDMMEEEDLRPLKRRDDFRALAQKTPTTMPVLPPSTFSSNEMHRPIGRFTNMAPEQQYMLSIMLGVTSGRGNSVREALAALDRSAAADGTAPRGTVYYMTNDDIRTRTRRWAYPAAIAKLDSLGIPAKIEEGILPQGKDDIIGLSAGSPVFDWPASGSKIAPGAICEHLTSAGGVMIQEGSQTPCTEWLRYGAAGSSGTVNEPMAIQMKFPNAFIQYYYMAGCSLIEAYYQTVYGPYMLLIVGDPLCKPWAKIPAVAVEGLSADQAVKGTVSVHPSVVNDVKSIQQFRLIVDGEVTGGCTAGESVQIDTTSLADGWHEMRVVAVVEDAIATQGEVVVPFVVDNHGGKVSLTTTADKNVTWGTAIPVTLASPDAQRIELFHNGRSLATVQGERGVFEVDSRGLGFGPIALQAVASRETDKGTQRVYSAPLDLTVIAPPPMPALAAPAEPMVKGLKLSWSDRLALVTDLFGGKALEQAGVKSGDDFVLDGFFEVPEDDTYQFQVSFQGPLGVSVDSHPLDWPATPEAATKADATATNPAVSGRWRFLPVTLAKGLHHFEARGQVANTPALDIRFGGPGAVSLSEKRFSHVGEPMTTSAPATAESESSTSAASKPAGKVD